MKMSATAGNAFPSNGSRPPRSANPDAFQQSLLHSHHYKQSSNLPRRLYVILCIIFQVDISPNDRCIIGKVIFAFTLLISIGYACLNITYTVFDIKSSNTKQTVTTGVFNMFITAIWVALGVYANRLGKRILKSASFVNSLRLHSKTVFKIPAALLLFLLAATAVSVNNYRTYTVFWNVTTCEKVSLDGRFCQTMFVFKVIQTLLVLVYNLCVASAVLSICRTHTIGVRRFIRSLENDGQTCEMKHRQRFMKMQFAASHNLSELYLPEQCYKEESDTDSVDGDGTSLLTYEPSSEPGAVSSSVGDNISINSGDVRQRVPRAESTILSKDDILFSYWKLSSRMRMTSRVLQRWTASWITFTILWSLKWVIVWLNHPSSYYEIAQFILPLLMIIVLCTAYGEVNGEAVKIISSITPLQDRLDVIRALPNQQIAMTLYNHPIEYTSILTVIAALGLALSSRMILDEFLPPSPHS